MGGDVYVDASLFMGMHSIDDSVRAACTSFFAEHLTSPLVMTYEEVGRCDDVVWSFSREEQDAYYPFMDVLHSLLPVRRRPYTTDDFTALTRLPSRTAGLTSRERMLLAAVTATGGRLVTVNPRLVPLAADGFPVAKPDPATGPGRFTEQLTELYATSLALKVNHAEL